MFWLSLFDHSIMQSYIWHYTINHRNNNTIKATYWANICDKHNCDPLVLHCIKNFTVNLIIIILWYMYIIT